MTIHIPPGVFDILPETQEAWKRSYLWQYLEGLIHQTAKQFGFSEIRTPMFERVELFQRGVGESSDIVSKEMYLFEDKGGRMMALRPEGTAPAMRAFIENQLHAISPIQKLYYIVPMFRYDRPQAGRYRQHHQFGAEAIGSGAPEQDVELIDLLLTVYRRLGLKNLTVYLNSIGDLEARNKFREALKSYLQPHFEKLSEDSRKRLEINPLRILDSKDPNDQEIVKDAPSILDFINSTSRDHFEEVKKYLTQLGIEYQVNKLLVRGLDYYNGTVFEVVSGELGAQNSMGGGGRYDGLLKTLGGPDLPAIGFGTGMERVLQTMLKQEVSLPNPPKITLFIIPLGDLAKEKCFTLTHELRDRGLSVEMDMSFKKLGKVMSYANQIGAKYVCVIGENELSSNKIELKEMETGKTKTLSIDEIESSIS